VGSGEPLPGNSQATGRDPIEQGRIDLPGLVNISGEAHGEEQHREHQATGHSAKDRPAPRHPRELGHGRRGFGHGFGHGFGRGRHVGDRLSCLSTAQEVLRPLRDRLLRLAVLRVHVAEFDTPDRRPKG